MSAAAFPQVLAGLTVVLGATAGAQSLQVNYAGAFESVGDTATCLAGTHPFGDVRACSGSIGDTPALAGSTLHGEGHATWANGIDSQAWATAGFGSLHAFAQTTNPGVSDNRNTQSRAAASMVDFITAGNAGGAAVTVYHYTVSVHGNLSPWLTLAGSEVGRTTALVNFFVSPICFDCNTVVGNRTSAVGLTNTTYGGSFSVASGVKFEIGFGLDVSTYAAIPAGQSATEQADYAHTVTLHIDGVTPGANTLGASGFNYATAAVPEPASALLLLAGLLGIAARRGWSSTTQEAA